jgi:hypothetical protein
MAGITDMPATKLLSLALCSAALLNAQSGASSGTITGSVLDASNAAIRGAAVTLVNPVSHYTKITATDDKGRFQFENIPYNNYHVNAASPGFQTSETDVDVRTPIPVETKMVLKVGAASSSVTVSEAGDLLETGPTAHTDVDRELFDKLPLESSSSSLSSLVTLASPGVAADSNGLFHGLGDHAQNSFSVDGQPITDQQSKVFSNQIPLDSVQSMEVIDGAPPAEYGDKTSLVIVVTTRSGLGAKEPHGEVTGSFGSFHTGEGGFNLLLGGAKWGNFISGNGMNSSRFLDTPELAVLHDRGNQQNLFDRIDYKPSAADTLNLNFGFTRSWFQTPNSYDAQNATAWSGLVVDNGGLGPNGALVGSEDQRSKIRTFNIAPTWTHLINSKMVFTLGGFARQDQYNYYPSRNPFSDLTPDLQSETIGQNRRLTNLGAKAELTYVSGMNNIKLGVMAEHTFITERDSFGLVDPTFNAPCLDANGNPFTDPALTDPNNCSGNLQQNPGFIPLLGCYDLTRTGTLPSSDGCATKTAGLYSYRGHADVKEEAIYLQDAITKGNWSFNPGARFDFYNGLARASQMEPRLGVAYRFKPTSTVLRISYARTLETPFNENLVLSSNGCNDAVISAFNPCQGGAAPVTPGWRNEFHAGLQQAFGRYVVVDAGYIWKYTHNAYDFSVLGNTPITFPVEWHNSKIPGFEGRVSVPNFHGLTAFIVMSSVAARFFTPQVTGIGAAPGDATVFRIDHDEKFNQTTHIQYQPKKTWPWISFNWRYDSGLVAGPVPCAGGNCNNGPNGADSLVDISNLSPDQQYQAGLYCGSIHATPTTPISTSGFCPAAQYGSTLISIPKAGTEDDDHNPPRIAPRNLFDVGIGDDNIFRGEKNRFSARLTVINLTDKTALYNFLSTFSGTHYVTPRTISVTVGFHF